MPDHKCSLLPNCPQLQIPLAPLAFPVPKDISHSLHVLPVQHLGHLKMTLHFFRAGGSYTPAMHVGPCEGVVLVGGSEVKLDPQKCCWKFFFFLWKREVTEK